MPSLVHAMRFVLDFYSYAMVEWMQAVELLGSLPFERSEIESKLKQARRIISLKNAAEYEDRLIKQNEAQEMLKDAQRLVEWVENKL
jgi:HEPN domain-containing protein